MRIDFGVWRRKLSARQRRIADVLASGEGARAVAKRFGVIEARISQIRRELRDSWVAFQGESKPMLAAGSAA